MALFLSDRKSTRLNSSHLVISYAVFCLKKKTMFSFLLNRVVYAPFLRRGTSHIGMVIVSLAVSLMVANLLLPIVGYYSVSYQDTTGVLIRAGGIVLTTNQIAIIGVAVVLMLLIHGLLRYTRLGKAMR